MGIVTSLLDLAGLALVVAAAAVFGGLPLALLVGGAAVLLVSWRLASSELPPERPDVAGVPWDTLGPGQAAQIAEDDE